MGSAKKNLYSSFVLLLLSTGQVHADIFQATASVSSGHYLREIELADDGPVLSVNFDWSSDNGLFLGSECHQGDAVRFEGFSRGCVSYLGYFRPLNTNSAISFEAKRYDYSRDDLVDWDTNEVSASWHFRNNLLVSISYSDEWLAWRTSTTGLDIAYTYPLSERLSVVANGGILRTNNPIAKFDTLRSGAVGFRFQHHRWSMLLKASLIDIDSGASLPFEFDESELSWSVSYQLY